MKKLIAITFTILSFSTSSFSGAVSNLGFCQGFIQGYKAFMGNNASIPTCPTAPTRNAINTPFQQGIKAGVLLAAQMKRR